jgi:hypothetical protein
MPIASKVLYISNILLYRIYKNRIVRYSTYIVYYSTLISIRITKYKVHFYSAKNFDVQNTIDWK